MKKKLSYISIILIVLLISSMAGGHMLAYADAEKINDWPLMKEAIAYEEAKDYTHAIVCWEALVDLYAGYSTSATYENGGHYADRAGDYYAGVYGGDVFDPIKATAYYEKAYASYVKFCEINGDAGNSWTYVSVQRKLDAIKSELELYVKSELVSQPPMARKLAKFEPESGLMIGLYGEGNEALYSGFGVDPAKVEAVYGKSPSSLLYYNIYGSSPFPKVAAEKMKAVGGSLQIHMQPFNLSNVKDDAYIHAFAKAAKESGIPVFLRFGGEMNGDWVSWGMQPDLYIAKFRLVHDILAKEAPNVAMVWAPNFFPWDNMASYYPGDAYVDWVGVSCYATLTYTQESKASKLLTNPIDLLSHVVAQYGDRKPIMIVEGAVSYTAALEPKIDYTDWAANNLKRFYEFIPRVYPEIKAMYYYDSLGAAGSQENYMLSENPVLKAVYAKIIKDDYYLSTLESADFSYVKLDAVLEKKPQSISAYVKSYEPVIGKVEYYIDGKLVKVSKALPFNFDYDFSKLTSDHVRITARAYLPDGTLIMEKDDEVKLILPTIKVVYRDAVIRFDQPPVVISGRTLVPMKYIFEAFGMDVAYEALTKTITATDSKHEVVLMLGQSTALVDGVEIALDVPVSAIAGRTMVPLKFIGQSIGLDVTYDGATRTVNIK
ncbi:stalk domain-containing protein [Fusibacter bizertensis]